MALLSYEFRDITQPIDFQFKDTEILFGREFRHVKGGIYKAVEPFTVGFNAFWKELEEYKESLCIIYKEIVQKEDENLKKESTTSEHGVEDGILSYHEIEMLLNGLRSGQTIDNDREIEIVYALNRKWCGVDNRISREAEGILEYLIENTDEKKYIDHCINNSRGWSETSFTDIWDILYPGQIPCEEDETRIEHTKPEMLIPVNYNPENKPLGQRPFMNYEGFIGVLIEEGIYYFGDDYRYRGRFAGPDYCEINLNCRFNEPCGMLGFDTDFHPTEYVGLRFFGIGEKAINRLHDLEEIYSDLFFHEFHTLSNEKKYIEPLILDSLLKDNEIKVAQRAVTKDRIEGELEEKLKNGEIELLVEGTEEIRMKNLTIRYKTLLDNPVTETCDFAYKQGDHIYLEKIETDNDKTNHTKKSVYLPIVTKLLVKKNIKLKCGMDFEIPVTVLDREPEVLAEVIKPEYVQYFTGEES